MHYGIWEFGLLFWRTPNSCLHATNFLHVTTAEAIEIMLWNIIEWASCVQHCLIHSSHKNITLWLQFRIVKQSTLSCYLVWLSSWLNPCIASLAMGQSLGQSYYCPSTSEVTLKNMDKCRWIHQYCVIWPQQIIAQWKHCAYVLGYTVTVNLAQPLWQAVKRDCQWRLKNCC